MKFPIMRNHLLTLVFCTVASFSGPQLPASPPKKVGEIKTEKQSFKTKSGKVIHYEIGTLFVHENCSDPKSRVIGVGFARFPAAVKTPTAPPVFRLPGGPGGSYLMRMTSYNKSQLERMFAELARLRAFSDVVFVDQRGFSAHGDVRRVTFRSPASRPDKPRTLTERVFVFKTFARRTVAEFAKRKIDLRGYTVKECAHDIADLRKALGEVFCKTWPNSTHRSTHRLQPRRNA